MGTPAGTLIDSDVFDAKLSVIDEQRFAVAGTDTWTKPNGAKYHRIKVQASGASGGGAATTAAGQGAVGSGGEAGAYVESFLPASAVGDTETVTVGAGVAGVSASAGNSGNTSSFGTLLSAAGGSPGNVLIASATVTSQTGGNSSQAMTGQIQIAGQTGGASQRNIDGSIGGAGGSCPMGQGGGSRSGNGDGFAGRGYGAGGGGAANGASQGAARTGGASPSGIVIVITYG